MALVEQHVYLIGHPISHSKSPVMHNAVYEACGLPWRYDLRDLPSRDEAVQFLTDRDFAGINITTPYKPLAFDMADTIAASASLAQGANVIVNKEGTLIAYNTDGMGCVNYLERQGVNLRGTKVVVCGTGPTSKAIMHAVAQAGPAEIALLSRDKSRAFETLREYVDAYGELVDNTVNMPAIKDNHLSFADAYKQVEFKYGAYETSREVISQADVIIDATRLGMNEGDPAPFDTSLLHKGQVVMDVVYGHGITALVGAAQEAGATVYDGAGMLVGQAVATVEIICDILGVELKLTADELFDVMYQAGFGS